MNTVIPENLRMLNLALVDIGAGTSDVAITKNGSVVAYGMIPMVGDEISEKIISVRGKTLMSKVNDERVRIKGEMGTQPSHKWRRWKN